MRSIFALVLVMLGLAMVSLRLPAQDSTQNLAVVIEIANQGIARVEPARRQSTDATALMGRTFSPLQPLIETAVPMPVRAQAGSPVSLSDQMAAWSARLLAAVRLATGSPTSPASPAPAAHTSVPLPVSGAYAAVGPDTAAARWAVAMPVVVYQQTPWSKSPAATLQVPPRPSSSQVASAAHVVLTGAAHRPPRSPSADKGGASALRPEDDGALYELARNLQRELKRVGCYHGEIDGDWGAGSQRGMAAFNTRVNAALPVDRPDYILLTLVQGHGQKACGTACPPGQVAEEDGGRCTPRAVIARATRLDATPIRRAIAQAPRGQPTMPRVTVGAAWMRTDAARARTDTGSHAKLDAGLDGMPASWPLTRRPDTRIAAAVRLPSLSAGVSSARQDSSSEAQITALPGRMSIGAPLPAAPSTGSVFASRGVAVPPPSIRHSNTRPRPARIARSARSRSTSTVRGPSRTASTNARTTRSRPSSAWTATFFD